MLGRERRWRTVGVATAACTLLACARAAPPAIDAHHDAPESAASTSPASAGAAPTAGNGAPPSTSMPSGIDPSASTDAGSTSAPAGPAPGATGSLPCEVVPIVEGRCQRCHGEILVGGTPMPLLSLADFQRDLVVKTSQGLVGQTMKAHALIRSRINSVTAPMPPDGPLPDSELVRLDAWLSAGAPAAAVPNASCPAEPPPVPVEPHVPVDPNETCFELRMHGGQTPDDTSPYTIESGESFRCFYYAVPWDADAQATRFGNVSDNEGVLHHWLLYTTDSSTPGRSVECQGPHPGDETRLLAAWARGGPNLVMPQDTALALPAPGTHLLLQWHLYNATGSDIADSSGVQVCTVPKGLRPRTAGITRLGTEDFGPSGMPPGVESRFSGTCVPGRAGVNGSDPIRIFALFPHMHELGRGMISVVNRVDGTRQEVFDAPFNVDYQSPYEVEVRLDPGDTITSTCVFFNDTPAAVGYGNSADSEMCYQFAFSSPAGALANGAVGLGGANHNCW